MKITVVFPLFALYSAVLVAFSPSAPADKVCPLLGPSFPKPSNLQSSPTFNAAAKALDAVIDSALKNGTTPYGSVPLKETTFSIGVYSANDKGLAYQRHFTDPVIANGTVGVRKVNADTVYRVGSTSKALTVLIFLRQVGFRKWFDPITWYLPEELFRPSQNGVNLNGMLPQWDQITIGDLASQLSGLERDYGLDDRSYPFATINTPDGPLEGGPRLEARSIPKCGYNNLNNTLQECTVEELIKGVSLQPAIFSPGHAPAYSNPAYSLLALIAENITGVPMSQMFQESLVQPLGLSDTFYDAPVDPSLGAIPVNTTAAGWSSSYGIEAPLGGYFTSTNDLATIGKAIMNYSLLSKPDTERWLKPVTFLGASNGAIGAPWEISRWQTPHRTYDMYAKDGGILLYGALFILVPDLNLGMSILAVSTDNTVLETVKFALSNLAAEYLLPAVQDVAREQADFTFSGTYKSTSINSSLTITTDAQPGMIVSEWISNGTDLLAELSHTELGDVRIWPNELYSEGQVGFDTVFGALQTSDVETPLNQCLTFGAVDDIAYGNVPLGLMVFTVDSASGRATSVNLEALRATLNKSS